MKRNGTEQLQMNGRGGIGIQAAPHERNNGHGEMEIARKIERSIAYMLQRLDKPLHVANLAAAVNFSPSHFSALFKRWTGCPPIDYFIHLRMQQACRLFDSTSLNVKEVAAALGYDDPFYFSRMFKAVIHIPPSEYRQKSADKAGAGLNGDSLLQDHQTNNTFAHSTKNHETKFNENHSIVHSQRD